MANTDDTTTGGHDDAPTPGEVRRATGLLVAANSRVARDALAYARQFRDEPIGLAAEKPPLTRLASVQSLSALAAGCNATPGAFVMALAALHEADDDVDGAIKALDAQWRKYR